MACVLFMNASSGLHHLSPCSDMYQFLATINKFCIQQGAGVYEEQQIERYVDDQFFAFTRGEVSRKGEPL